ncbi:MAG: LysM peptidoglycan-binding domain-containing protein [Paludibacteraceae bacterium]|nr:LysM peptidoglycan-binding domain-containing protein [Paludibacteraceae bacterium]
MKRIAILSFVFAILAVTAVAEEVSYPKITKDGKQYYVYTVQKSEGFYAISRKFNVTIKEIADANQVDGGLKLGQELYIPIAEAVTDTVKSSDQKLHTIEKGDTFYNVSKRYGLSVQELQNANPCVEILSIGNTLVIPSVSNEPAVQPQPVATIAEPVKENPTDNIFSKHNKFSSVSIAVLMPFNLSENTDSDNKFIDFYRGCLIAADSIKSNGTNLEIQAYDIGMTKESLMNTLSKPELRNVDIIIGPAYSSQIQYVAEFAETHRIKAVIPFSNNVPQIEDNKYLYQVICPQSDLYDNVIDSYLPLWKDKKILIAKPDSAGIRYNKKDFSDKLVAKLDKRSIYYKYISGERIAAETNMFTSQDSSDVVLVIPTVNNVKMSQISTHLEQIKSERVSIFGFPEWNDILHKDIYSKPLYMFSNYRLDFTKPSVIEFYNKYYKKFGTPSKQNNPSYSIFGFDITYYIANAWFNNDAESEMLQMNFNFEKIPGGGYANHGILIQRYDKDGIMEIRVMGQGSSDKE